MELNRLIGERGYKTIEVHPTSTRKALHMLTKDYEEIGRIFAYLGIRGAFEERSLTFHEVEGYIIVPKKKDWRMLEL
jgi:predicted nuclease with RNAse H fold